METLGNHGMEVWTLYQHIELGEACTTLLLQLRQLPCEEMVFKRMFGDLDEAVVVELVDSQDFQLRKEPP